MGYTTYFSNKEVDQITWDAFIKDVKKLYKNMPTHSESSGAYYVDHKLALNGCGKFKNATFNKNTVHFNGEGEIINTANNLIYNNPNYKIVRVKEEGWYTSKVAFGTDEKLTEYMDISRLSHETFDLKRTGSQEFCKTERKPYDFMVQAVLIIAMWHFADKIEVSSDGDKDDWAWTCEKLAKLFPTKYYANHVMLDKWLDTL